MPNSPGRLGPGAAPGPIAPTHRPRWLLVLSAFTLMQGGMLLISGLGDLRNPTALPPSNLVLPQPLSPQAEAATRELLDVSRAILERHARAIRVRAAASLALALLLLYSAAAALSRDRHGRKATLIAAWLGIAYQLGSLPVTMPIAEDHAAMSAPLVARAVAPDLTALAADPGAATAGAGGALARPEIGAAVDGGAATARTCGASRRAVTPTRSGHRHHAEGLHQRTDRPGNPGYFQLVAADHLLRRTPGSGALWPAAQTTDTTQVSHRGRPALR